MLILSKFRETTWWEEGHSGPAFCLTFHFVSLLILSHFSFCLTFHFVSNERTHSRWDSIDRIKIDNFQRPRHHGVKSPPKILSKIPVMNIPDLQNPLRIHPTEQPTEKSQESTKSDKRKDKIARDILIQSNKDTTDAMDVKFNEITLTVNETLDKGLKNGFKDIAQELGQLAKVIKESMLQNRENLIDQPIGITRPKDQPSSTNQEFTEMQVQSRQLLKKINKPITDWTAHDRFPTRKFQWNGYSK